MKDFIKKTLAWLRLALTNVIDFAESYAPAAVIITEEIQIFVEKNAGQLERITQLTPSTKDDKKLAEVLELLPGVAKTVAESRDILTGGEDDEEILRRFYEMIKASNESGKATLYADTAAGLLIAIVSKKLPTSIPKWLALIITQAAFARIFKGA